MIQTRRRSKKVEGLEYVTRCVGARRYLELKYRGKQLNSSGPPKQWSYARNKSN